MQRAVVKSLVLAASLSFGSSLALAADLPSPVVLSGDAHEVTVHQVASGLRALGYADIAPINQDGRIFTTTAVWQGMTHNLRINGEFGTVTDASADTRASADRDLPGPVLFASSGHKTNVNQARAGLAALGYNVRSISQDGTIFDARADLDGRTLDLRIDADTGQVTMIGATPANSDAMPSIRLAADAHEATRNEVARALADAGYQQIRNVTNDGRIFNADAAWQGREVALRIDARSGAVTVQ